jgi:hypothetical protein
MAKLIPDLVLPEVQSHISRMCGKGERGWRSGRADEDTLTGDFCGNLRSDWSSWQEAGKDSLRWQVDYLKIGGRGKGAPESRLGADGIFQIELFDIASQSTKYKGFLFQAKKDDNYDSGSLLTQATKMKAVTTDGAVIFRYGPKGYRAIVAEAVIEAEGRLSEVDDENQVPLCEFLAHEFAACSFGVQGLHFENGTAGTADRLYVSNSSTDYIELRGGDLKHVSSIQISRIKGS